MSINILPKDMVYFIMKYVEMPKLFIFFIINKHLNRCLKKFISSDPMIMLADLRLKFKMWPSFILKCYSRNEKVYILQAHDLCDHDLRYFHKATEMIIADSSSLKGHGFRFLVKKLRKITLINCPDLCNLKFLKKCTYVKLDFCNGLKQNQLCHLARVEDLHIDNYIPNNFDKITEMINSNCNIVMGKPYVCRIGEKYFDDKECRCSDHKNKKSMMSICPLKYNILNKICNCGNHLHQKYWEQDQLL